MAADKKVPIISEGGRIGRTLIYDVAGSYTYNKPTGLRAVMVECQAGGGGAGSPQNTSAGQSSCSSGGTGGSYSRSFIQAEDLAASETVTVGAGGAAGAANGNAGFPGGVSSLGSHVTAIGGLGGTFSTATTGTRSIDSDTHTNSGTGDVTLPGGLTTGAFIEGANDIHFASKGGDSFYGSGGRGRIQNGTGASSEDGSDGAGYGGGGGGALNTNNGDNAVGGAGSSGIVIITEYY